MPIPNPLRPVIMALLLSFAPVAPAAANVSALVERMTARAPSATTIILVDVSGSVAPDDRAIYGRSIAAAADGLRPGDRILIAHVGDADRGQFRALLDHSVPRTNVRLDQEDALRRSRERVRRAGSAALSDAPRARQTRLLEAIAAAAQAFGARPAPGSRLILLTDAVEESPTVDLSRRPLDAAARNETIARARSDGLVPRLDGVSLHIVGAGGRHYASVEAFWRSWATATGARLEAYGRLPFRGAA
jgi:hypothetical protein